jgi:GT2 family glycosyltransferase
MTEARGTLRPVLEDVSVVIPTLGRPILQDCLDSIVEANAWPARIIVTDQSSSPTVAGYLARVQDRGIDTLHIPSGQRGRALGVNRGIERVETPYLAITDDDCLVDPDWLVGMVRILSERPLSVVTGRVDATGDEPVALVVDSSEPALYRRPRLTFDAISGGNMGTSLDVMERVGLLDEDPCVQCAEDGEWAYRALRSGVAIVYAPDVIVAHRGWRTLEERGAQFRAYARSHGGFYGKYLRKRDLFIAARVLVHHARSLRRWIRGVRSGDPELALIGRSYFTGLVPGILAGLRSTESPRHPDLRASPASPRRSSR